MFTLSFPLFRPALRTLRYRKAISGNSLGLFRFSTMMPVCSEPSSPALSATGSDRLTGWVARWVAPGGEWMKRWVQSGGRLGGVNNLTRRSRTRATRQP